MANQHYLQAQVQWHYAQHARTEYAPQSYSPYLGSPSKHQPPAPSPQEDQRPHLAVVLGPSHMPEPAQPTSGRVIDEKDERSSGWLANLKPRDPLNPPPPSWSRPLDRSQLYVPFAPVIFKSKGHWLEDSFPLVYPAEEMLSHDVTPDDWKRFIEDIGLAGRITGRQKLVADVLPGMAHMGVSGFFVSKAIKKNMKKNKIPKVYDLVDKWNYEFFNQRGVKLSIVPEWDEAQEDSSDSSDDENAHPAAGVSTQTTEFLTAKQQRRAAKRERKSKRREHKKERKEHRRLKKRGKYNMRVQCV